MNRVSKLAIVLAVSGFSAQAFSENQLRDIFAAGVVEGNIRVYYNIREYDFRNDESAFSLGGALRAKTGNLGPLSIGVGYYTAQDLGTNNDDPSKVNTRLGSDLEVLGEAYLKFDFGNTSANLGRQKIATPWANPGDAFMIPFTFQGYEVVNTSIQGFTLHASYLEKIKNRNSDEFVNVDSWVANRYGVATPADAGGTVNLGVAYKAKAFSVESWFTQFSEFFDTLYLNSSYSVPKIGRVEPFVGLQYAIQRDSGQAALGNVDSQLYGLKVGAGLGPSSLTLAYNSVSEEASSLNNGAFLAPFSYSTSPLYTNNMLETLENLDSGDAWKITFDHNVGSHLKFKVSYADFDFNQVPDRNATDLDVIYLLDRYFEGLSFRWRVEIVRSDVESVEQINHRFQMQFTF